MKDLKLNLSIANYELGKSIDNITLVWEHLEYIKLNDKYCEIEKGEIVVELGYYKDKLRMITNKIKNNIEKWSE